MGDWVAEFIEQQRSWEYLIAVRPCQHAFIRLAVTVVGTDGADARVECSSCGHRMEDWTVTKNFDGSWSAYHTELEA
jgi:hypothetical protein